MSDPKGESLWKRRIHALAVVRRWKATLLSKAEEIDGFDALFRMRIAVTTPVDVVECYHIRRVINSIWEMTRPREGE